MKRSYQSLSVCACVLIGAGAAGLGVRFFSTMTLSRLDFQLVSELDRADPRYDKVMCGPISLSAAFARVGVSISPMDVAAQCKVIAEGVALRDLERVANRTDSITASAGRLNWDELRQLDGVAVLFVRGNHYVAADPREVPQGDAKTAEVRIYEPDTPAQWWSREKLEKAWAGESLVIRRQPAQVNEGGANARIEWDECYIDQGVLSKNTRIAHYQFSFRNVGNDDLVIGEIQKSCACIDHALSKERLAPGEAGTIGVSVDLDGKEGYFGQYVHVYTNDLSNPVTVLRMKGGVPRARATSVDLISLRDLPRGGRASHEFYVGDPGFSGVKICEEGLVPDGNSVMDEHLSCMMSHDKLGAEKSLAKRWDYVVLLEFAASSMCPLGPFRREVKVVLETDGATTTHRIAIEGTIVQDVQPLPRLALITADSDGAGSATIQLQSGSRKEFKVVKMWSGTPDSLRISRAGESQDLNAQYLITAQLPNGISAEMAPLQRAALFELDDGSVVSVPVAIFRPPH